MRRWTTRHWLWAATGAVVVAVVTGAVTVLIPNQVFTRMVQAPWWAYPVWIASALLSGLLIATYVADTSSAEQRRRGSGGIAGAVLSVLAVGCPACNKLVVLALGANGALTWFAPVQPVLAIAALALLVLALWKRLRAPMSCPAPAATRRR